MREATDVAHRNQLLDNEEVRTGEQLEAPETPDEPLGVRGEALHHPRVRTNVAAQNFIEYRWPRSTLVTTTYSYYS